MKNSTKRFFSAMGSILDISPSGNYSDDKVIISDTESIRSDWNNVGDYLKGAIEDNDQKKITKKSHHPTVPSHC
ncbi:MAG: hypothetical protein ACJ8LD_10590 [Pantoea agglomerans]